MRANVHPSRHKRSAVGLVELLIALAISAALLVSVGVATDASFNAYAINEEQSNLTQRARLTIERLNIYIRTCKEHAPATASKVTQFAGGATVTDSGIAMFDDAGNELEFAYDSATQRLMLTTGGHARVLLRGVTAFTVKMEPMQSKAAIRAATGFDLLRRATILLTLRTSGNSADINETTDAQTVSFSCSVMPRRNSW